MLPFKHYHHNRSKSVLAIWKPSIGKIYIVLSNCIFAKNSNAILVGINNFIRLLFSIKATLKCLRIYPMGFCAGFPAIIEARMPGSSSNLYSLVAIRVQRPARHCGVDKNIFNHDVSIQKFLYFDFPVLILELAIYLIRQAVDLVRQAVGPYCYNYADCYNPITYVNSNLN